VPLVVDYSASRRSLSTTPPRAGSSSTTLPPPRVRVPRHVARLTTRIVARLVVDYFAYAARLGASARRAAHFLSSTTSPTPRDRVPRHVVRFIACRRLLHRRCTTGCLGTSCGLLCGSLRRSSSTTSPTPRVRVPRHVTRPVTGLIVDYSMRRNFVLRPHWLYFSHAVRHDYLSRGNASSPLSMPRAAATSSSGCIASTIHLN
jgi:hypothetical protein